MTGYSLAQVAALTLPQLHFLLAGQGPILYPRLKPQLDEAFAQLSSKLAEEGKESDIDRVLREDAERQAARARGETVPLTSEEEKRERAYRVRHRFYLGEETKPVLAAPPIPGLPPETAAAILQACREGLVPLDIYRADVLPRERALRATAARRRP